MDTIQDEIEPHAHLCLETGKAKFSERIKIFPTAITVKSNKPIIS